MKSFKDLREKTLTGAEKKKREEIAKAKANQKPEKFVKPHPEVIKAYKKKLAADDKAADWSYGGSKARLTRATNHLTKKIDQHHPGLDTRGRIDLYTTLQNMKEAVEEKTLTAAELKKREEIAKAMERDNPGMDMKKKMAIATATAKRVAEESDDRDELTKKLFPKKSPKEMEKADKERNRKMNQKRFMKPSKPSRSREWGVYEEVELDEGIENMSHARLKWHMNTGVPHGRYTKDEMKAERDRRLSKVDTHAAYKKAKPSMNEEADSSMCCKHCGDEFGKPTNEKCMYDAYDPKGKNWVKKESYNEAKVDEISLSHLSNTIAKSTGTKNIKTAMKPGEVKKGLDDLKKRLATLGQDPKMAKEAYRVHAVSKDGEKMKSGLHPTKKAASDMHYKMAKSGMYKKIEVVKETVELDEAYKFGKHIEDHNGHPIRKYKNEYLVYAPGHHYIHTSADTLAKARAYAADQKPPAKPKTKAQQDHDDWRDEQKRRISSGEVRKAVILHRRGVKEEVQIDEVLDTPKAMDSYRNKAKYSKDRAANSAAAKMLRNPNGFKSTDTSDELHTMDKRAKGLKMADKAAARKTRAMLMKKEETQLDEISKKTLGSYVKKASANIASTSADNARDYATGNRPVGINKKGVKIMKRTKYVNKAVDKMTQETVMSADKKPEKYVKPDGTIGIRMVRVDKNVVDKDA